MQNREIYIEKMEKGMEDKLFFLDCIDDEVEYIVDFGCANAALGKAIELYSNKKYIYIGYDNSREMLSLALQNNPSGTYFSRLEELIKTVKEIEDKAVVVFSSVLHEIYSYGEEYKLHRFMSAVNPRYIAVRDMYLDFHCNPSWLFLDKGYNNTVAAKVIKEYVQSKYNYTSGTSFKEIYQLWLKYSYEENWDRESEEDYFAADLEYVMPDNYDVEFMERFTIDFLVQKAIKDFGFNPFVTDTHIKFVMKRID